MTSVWITWKVFLGVKDTQLTEKVSVRCLQNSWISSYVWRVQKVWWSISHNFSLISYMQTSIKSQLGHARGEIHHGSAQSPKDNSCSSLFEEETLFFPIKVSKMSFHTQVSVESSPVESVSVSTHSLSQTDCLMFTPKVSSVSQFAFFQKLYTSVYII